MQGAQLHQGDGVLDCLVVVVLHVVLGFGEVVHAVVLPAGPELLLSQLIVLVTGLFAGDTP